MIDKNSKVESFETTSYGPVDGSSRKAPKNDVLRFRGDQKEAVRGLIEEIVRDLVQENPAYGVIVKFEGDHMRLVGQSYEMNIHLRIRQVEDFMRQVLDGALKHIKKEFKARGAGSLTLSEDKSRAGTNIQKVSLNQRSMYTCWRYFTIG